MTIWLWIIGIIALIWPIVLMLHVDYDFMKKLKREGAFSVSYANASSKRLREEISNLQSFIEKQDALIAALWEHSFDFQYDGGNSTPEMPTHLGVKPEWSTMGYEPGVVEYIYRGEPYPWKTRAENFYMFK